VGSACGTGLPDCAPLLTCDTSGHCALKPHEGEPCTSSYGSSNCLWKEDYCQLSAPDGGGICARRPYVCEPCGTEYNQTTNCQTGLCNAAAHQCQPDQIEGDDCSSFANCGTGLWCSTATVRCEKLPGAGSPCTPARKCAPAAWCLVPDGGVSGQCLAKLAEGSACTSDDQCAGTAYCHPGTNQCMAVYGTVLNKTCVTYFSSLVFFAMAAGAVRLRTRRR
jgi:hypothetical protein